MTVETPQPRDRVRISYEAEAVTFDDTSNLNWVRVGDKVIGVPADATVEVLERALCAEIEGATGIVYAAIVQDRKRGDR